MITNFNKWDEIAKFDLDTTANYILTGRKANDFYPDSWLFEKCGDRNASVNVLDFGCGIGRNTYEMAMWSKLWNVVGYDNENMIIKAKQYKILKYKNTKFKNAELSSNWDNLKTKKFHSILCCIVLQHIYEPELIDYINDFKKMTKVLIVSGRRNNDDNNKNTWGILEKCGLFPVKCINNIDIEYKRDGPNEEHFTCLYEL